MIAYAHKYAFPYGEFVGENENRNNNNGSGASVNNDDNNMTRNLLSDNFALTDTVKDFNDSKILPNIVLPTGFVPGKGVENMKNGEQPPVNYDMKRNAPVQKKKIRSNSYGWRD